MQMEPDTNGASPDRALPGFAHMRRVWDATIKVFAVKVLPGEYYVTAHDEMIVTVLGSCIAACVRDPVCGIGGMNHFMLPARDAGASGRWGDERLSASARYGNVAMEHLINAILKHGGRRERLEVKIFGGGRVLASLTDVGRRNIEFVREYLDKERLKLVAEDVGDVSPRKLRYFPASGRVQLKKLHRTGDGALAHQEMEYMQRLQRAPVEGEVVLFKEREG